MMKLSSLIRHALVIATTCGVLWAPAGLAANPPGPRLRPEPTISIPKPPTTSFNRNAVGGASGVNPFLRQRAYNVIDGLQKPGGAGAMGLRSHAYRNDGRNGSTLLPKTTPSGKPIDYTTTYMRPYAKNRGSANARVVTGSDGSAWLSRHYGEKGGKVGRIQ